MTEIASLVDVEALLIAYLEQDATFAPLVGGLGNAARVATDAPSGPTPAAQLQLFRASGTTVDLGTGHVERAIVQTNAYGPTKPAAWDVIADAYRALLAAARTTHTLGVVTAVERLTGPTDSPDPISGAPRYTASFAVTVHPAPAG